LFKDGLKVKVKVQGKVYQAPGRTLRFRMLASLGRRLRPDIAANSQSVRVFAQCGNAKSDVLFERDSEFLGASADIIPRDAARKRFILHAFLHRVYF
jgi:hypothetical protein